MMMRKRDWFRFFWPAFVSLWLVACGGGTADTPVSVEEGPGVRGEVLAAASGEPLEGVEIYTAEDGVLARTDVQGQYVLRLPAGTRRTLRLRKDGYTSQSFPVTIDDTLQGRDFTLRRRGPVVRIPNAQDGFEYADPQGARVVIPPGSLVYHDAQGQEQPVQGEVLLQVTPVDVADDREVWAFPGRFAGTDINGAPAELILSYGTVEFVFTLPDGTPVNLGSSAPRATIEIPVFVTIHPDGSQIRPGDSNQAVWSLDETTGLWRQESDQGVVVESTASPTGLALRAEVSHFSWWNFDFKAGSYCLTPIEIRGLPAGISATITARLSRAAGLPAYATAAVGGNGTIYRILPGGMTITLSGEAKDAPALYATVEQEFTGCERDPNTNAIMPRVLDFGDRGLPPEINRFDAYVTPIFAKDATGRYQVVANDVVLRIGVRGATRLQLADQTADTLTNLRPRQRIYRVRSTADKTFILYAENAEGQASSPPLVVTYVNTASPVIDSAYYVNVADPNTGDTRYEVYWDVRGADNVRVGYLSSSAADLNDSSLVETDTSTAANGMIAVSVPPFGGPWDLFIEATNGTGAGAAVRRFSIVDFCDLVAPLNEACAAF